MAREIGYFYYVSRSKIQMFGSGDFASNEDNGYVYGWLEDTLTNYSIRAYLKTFDFNTPDAKAGLQFRELAKSNVPFSGIMVDGDGYIKIYRRLMRDGIVLSSNAVNVSQTQGIWFQIRKFSNNYYFEYSLQPESTSTSSIIWVTLDSSVDDTDAWTQVEKHINVCSGDDFVNEAYFTNVYTEGGWVSPVGQKEV